MTIQIKGTRETEGNEIPADRYRFSAGQVATKLPLFFGVALAAILGFIKSATPATNLPVPEEPEATPEPQPRGMSIVAADDMSLKAESPSIEEHEEADRPRPRSDDDSSRIYHRYDNVVQFPVRQHALIDSPPIAFSDVVVPPEAQLADPGPSDGGSSAPRSASASMPGGNRSAAPAETQRRNRSPEGRDGPILLQEAFAGTAIVIGLDQFLSQVVDPDGDKLSIKNVTVSSGSIAETEGGFIYSSNAQAKAGQVVVNFEVTDGTASVVRTALIPLLRGPINGTPDAEHILGTDGADTISSLAGADFIDAMAGDDFIIGGDGDDVIVAGLGDDVVWAGLGNDVVLGGGGDDALSGGEGDDRLVGDTGDDVLLGEVGNDLLQGEDGDDTVMGGAGDDLVDGGAGADVVQGDAGDDELHDGAGEDLVFGGEGDDLAVAAMDAAVDFLEGGEGFDTMDYSAATTALTFDFVAGSVSSEEAGDDQFSGFEAVVGGSEGDTFMIGNHEMELTGGDGDDTFVFALPDDIDRPMLVHDILDFIVGDRIKVAAFEFTMDHDEAAEDRFGRYYRDRDDEGDPNALELRIRHIHDDDNNELTVFEFDMDGNFEFEMTVTVHGYQQPFVYETATA